MTWSQIIKAHPEANFLQSPEWESTNQLLGVKTIVKTFPEHGHALMLVRNAKRGRYLEIPCGPLIDWHTPSLVNSVFQQIISVAKTNHCVFIRLRPQLLNTPKNLKILSKLDGKISPMHLSAEHTVMLDLSLSLDQLLSNMRRQTRYEIRRAKKQKITVETSTSETSFREFHQVQLSTAKRQNFIPPNLKTLLAEHTAFKKNAIIYIAKQNNQPLAYGLILISGNEADYYEAASTPLNRKLPGAYALLWQAIKDLKQQGIKRFNLWGIAPPNQPHHRYAGVTIFKTGFGGKIIEYVPAHDIILKPSRYLANFVVETIRKKRRHL